MKEQFINDLIVKLEPMFNINDLSIIKNELSYVIQNYEINKRQTDLDMYTGYLPECFQIYFVTRKIEGMSDKSLLLYNMYLKDLFQKLNKPIEQISANDIRAYLYLTQKERNISNRTLDSRRSIIHSFFEWACNEEYIQKNPCRGCQAN